MNWNPFGLFAFSKNADNGNKSKVTSTEVAIGQLFENSPLIEVIEFVSIPLEEKKEKLRLEREKRLKRKAEAQNPHPKTT